MTKVIVASDEFSPQFSDVVAYLQQQIPHMHEYEVTVIVPDISGEHYPVGDAHIVRVPKGLFGYKTGIIKALVKEHDKAIIHTTGSIGRAVAKECDKQHKTLECYVHEPRFDFLYNVAETVFVPTKQAKEILIQQGVNKRVEVQPYDVDLKQFSAADDKEAVKELLGILPHELVIGVKGPIPQYVLESFAVLKETNPHLKLFVLGEKQILDDRDIMFYSPQHSLEKYFQSLDMFIGDMSYLALLAMSCELVVVTDATGMYSHLVSDKQTVLTYPSENSTVLRLKLQWVLDQQTEREAISFRARGVVQKLVR